MSENHDTRKKHHAQKIIYAPDDEAALAAFATALGEGRQPPRQLLATDPERVERDLARLVLSVIELLRQVLERQAVRRVESGALSEEQVEQLGETLLRLETRMGELKTLFGLGDYDMTFDLGQLRDLVSSDEEARTANFVVE